MLSNHEFVVAVRDNLYPKIREIENKCLDLFHIDHCIGPTVPYGKNEVVEAIHLLQSSANFLIVLAKEQHIELPESLLRDRR